MWRRGIAAVVLMCGLFSGHLLAQRQGHDYFPMQSLEQRLLHEADCDELRSRAEETASSLREHYHRQYARKAKAHNCPP
ncbi:DUF2554 family protein [Klebsiella aerogenes]|uniref:DUF2554 family protein n=1 Tax=Klebsiella aerogenes TaxID=548 RepID=UPI003890FABD|nr:DUF2554 family protein [Klebsiella aerogenes]